VSGCSDELEIYCKAWPVRADKHFHKQEFVLDWDQHIIRCPAAQEMSPIPGGVVHFPKDTCSQCPLKAQCTTSAKGRSVSIHLDEALLIELRQRQQTPEGRAKLREWVARETLLPERIHLFPGNAFLWVAWRCEPAAPMQRYLAADTKRRREEHTHKKEKKMQQRAICYWSEGIACAGTLYLPETLTPSHKAPVAVLGHGTTYVKEMHRPSFARTFVDVGLIALAIDYRYLGESKGEPRFQVDPREQAQDYSNVILGYNVRQLKRWWKQ
jgi:hypothetical protein